MSFQLHSAMSQVLIFLSEDQSSMFFQEPSLNFLGDVGIAAARFGLDLVRFR